MGADDILERALALPRAAREELAERLLRTLDESDGTDSVAAAWDQEIAARIERYERGAEQTVSWDELRARLAERRTRTARCGCRRVRP